MRERKNLCACLLALLFVLCGCTPAATDVMEDPMAAPAVYDLSWQKGFRDVTLPEGGMRADEIAFARATERGYEIDTLSRTALEEYDDDGYLPRYSMILDRYDASLQILSNCIGYAMQHHYRKFILPMDAELIHQLHEADRSYWWSIDIQCDTDKSNSIKLEDGRTIFFCLCVLKPWPGSDYEEFLNEQAAAFAAAKAVMAMIPKDCVSDYDKALYLYRYLTDRVDYAHQENGHDEDYYLDAQNVYYDTLIKKRTVCAGYGRTFAWLCEMAGLEAFPVTGQYGETGSHLWTMVKVDGETYWFDPTWDEDELPERYLYFGISDEEMEERGGSRHLYQAYEELLPACPSSLPLPEIRPLAVRRGTSYRGSYTNETLGLQCQLPSDFFFLDDIELNQGSGEPWTPFEELFREESSAIDMAATSRNGAQVVVFLDWLRGGKLQTSEQECAQELMDSILEENENDDCTLVQRDFCGRLCWGIRRESVSEDGAQRCILYVVYRLDRFLVVVRAEAKDEAAAQTVLDCFARSPSES